MNRKSVSDYALLRRYRRGDGDAATELYVKYAGRLQDVVNSNTSEQLSRRVESDDVVQSVFRTFFRRVSEGYFEVPRGEEIWSLFLVLALNKIRQAARYHYRGKRDFRLTTQLRDVEIASAQESTPFVILRATIQELYHGLSTSQRRMVEMRIQGYELKEIATETRRSTRTVERVLKQFRDRLSRQIQ